METIIADGKELDSPENMELLVYYSLSDFEAIKSVNK